MIINLIFITLAIIVLILSLIRDMNKVDKMLLSVAIINSILWCISEAIK